MSGLLMESCVVIETETASDAGDDEVGDLEPDTHQLGFPGDPCNNDDDCFSGVCVSDLCRAGTGGDPCNDDDDCAGATPLCGPGEAGCQSGIEGQDCDSASDCAEGAPICASTNVCQDGTHGDPCTVDDDCAGATPFCGPDAECQSGIAGDGCTEAGDCTAAAPYCRDGTCHAGQALGEECRNGADCGSGYCSNGHCTPVVTLGDTEMWFAYIPDGSFWMGSPEGCPAPDGYPGDCTAEIGRDHDEPLHHVTLTRPFFLAETEVTQAQWLVRFEQNPSVFSSCPDCPVETVSWWEAIAYLNALSVDEGLQPCYQLTGCEEGVEPGSGMDCAAVAVVDPGASGNPYDCEGYRLPTEAEWEYAYRAGTTTATYTAGITNIERTPIDSALDAVAWYGGNSAVTYAGFDCSDWGTDAAFCGTHPVAGKTPNEWGLYDMAGNVWEWAWDWYESLPTTAVEDPLAEAGSVPIVRGGSWNSIARYCRAAIRNHQDGPTVQEGSVGFRPARTVWPAP